MRKHMYILALCLFLALINATAQADTCDSLKAGGTDHWFPVAYIDTETGRPEGIAHDFVRYVGRQLELPVQIYADIPWKRVMEYVEEGRYDFFTAIYWTSERAETYIYTVPYAVSEVRVFVRRGNEFEFDSLDDLKGRVGGIPLGGSFGNEFDTYAREHDLKLEEVPTKEQRVGKVLMGRTDYFIQDYLDAMIYLKDHDLDNQIVALPTPITTTNIHFAFSRRSPCADLVPRVNEIIREAREDGTLDRIIQENMKEVTPEP